MNRTSVGFRSYHPEILCLFPEIRTHYNFEDHCSSYWETKEEEEIAHIEHKKRLSELMTNLGFTVQTLADPMWTFYNPTTNQTYYNFDKYHCDFKKDAPLHLAENADTFIHSGMIIEKSYAKFFPKLKYFIGSGNSHYEPEQDDIDNYGEPVLTSLFWENPEMMQSYTAFREPDDYPYHSPKITADYVRERFIVSHHSSLQDLYAHYRNVWKQKIENEYHGELEAGEPIPYVDEEYNENDMKIVEVNMEE